MKKSFYFINKCQISKSKNIKKIISLGKMPLVNSMYSTNQDEPEYFAPLDLFYCPISKLVQLGIVIDKEILFPKSYPYTSSTTKALRDNFLQLRKDLENKNLIKNNDLIIDIGSNDGNLLSNFIEKYKVLGITPEIIGKIAIKRGIPTIIDYFNDKNKKLILKKYGKAKIITATNVFAHMDNISNVIKNIKNLLLKDGTFISESHYLMPLLKLNQYDTIYHEHLRYYSLTSLNFLFKKHGLEIFDAKKIDTHGGSIRVYASIKGERKIENIVSKIIQEEKIINLKFLLGFQRKITLSKLKLMSLLNDLKSKNRSISGISAPSRATTLINYCGLDKDIIDNIFEINGSKKIGKNIPGTSIPVIKENFTFIKKIDYLLIFSWHIQKQIINTYRRKGYKGKFIVPLPMPKII